MNTCTHTSLIVKLTINTVVMDALVHLSGIHIYSLWQSSDGEERGCVGEGEWPPTPSSILAWSDHQEKRKKKRRGKEKESLHLPFTLIVKGGKIKLGYNQRCENRMTGTMMFSSRVFISKEQICGSWRCAKYIHIIKNKLQLSSSHHEKGK